MPDHRTLGPRPGPLSGIRVIEFGQFIAVPAAAQALAELGADVVKVEPPGGDAARHIGWTRDAFGPMFTAYNRDKRSIVLDLRRDEDRRRAFQLASRADVVLQNARPGAMEKQGLGASRMLESAPRLVYGQVSGFGQEGPASARAGFDIAAQAESGMMSLNGEAERDPVRVGFTVVDIMAAQAVTSAVLAALIGRSASGKGGLVDVSLIDVAISALANTWTEYQLTGKTPTRSGNGQPNVAPAAEVVRAQDGMIVLSAYTEHHFPLLCRAIGRPELSEDARFATNAARVAHRPALRDVLQTSLQHLSSDAACDMLAKAGVVAGAVRSISEVKPGHAGVSSDLFVEVLAEGRSPVRVPRLPLALRDVLRQEGRLPALGEHTDEVLAELG